MGAEGQHGSVATREPSHGNREPGLLASAKHTDFFTGVTVVISFFRGPAGMAQPPPAFCKRKSIPLKCLSPANYLPRHSGL
jgi:hypothetical protein